MWRDLAVRSARAVVALAAAGRTTRDILTPASVTNAIDRLELDSLVERVEHPTDRRTTLAAITRAGRRRVRIAAKALNEGVFGQPGLAGDQLTNTVASLAELRRASNDFATEAPHDVAPATRSTTA